MAAAARESLSAAQARRIALAAQGLGGARPGLPPTGLALQRGIARLGLLQLDSVSVLVRAHYLPLFSRLGHYDRALLDGLAAHAGEPPHPRRRKLFEYWAHEASLLPVELQPLLRWRMARAAAGEGTWSGIARLATERPELIEGIYRRVRDEGPMGVSGLEQRQRTGPWWGWSEGKIALEWLFWTGRLTAAGRRGFERVYDLPERVLPPEILARPTIVMVS